MSTGIRAEIRVDAPTGCPTTQAVTRTGTSTADVARAVSGDGERVVEEFLLADPVGVDLDDVDADAEFEVVFDYGDHVTYRFERDRDVACPCETVDANDCPVVDVSVRGEDFHLTFHAPDMSALQSVIGELRDAFPSLDVKRLLRSEGEADTHNLVFVDRGRLTERQFEVLQTAHRMGYFDHPKGANAGDVADALDITRSTFSEHLAAAQSKLLDAILE
jgi:hypothetical protein